MAGGAGRNLGRMGDKQNLRGLRQALQPLAHRVGHRAADAAIHLVEHQGGGRRHLRQRHFQSQGETRQLATRSDLGQAAEGRAFHGGDLKGDAFQAKRPAFFVRRQRDAEFGVTQLERGEFTGHRLFQFFGGSGAGLGEFLRRGNKSGAGGGDRDLCVFHRGAAAVQRLALGQEIRQHPRKTVRCRGVFARQRPQRE